MAVTAKVTAIVIILLLLLLTIIIMWRRCAYPTKYFLSALVTAKNEAMILDEFLQHLRAQGFDHVFLIDNGSKDGSCDKALSTYGSGFLTIYKLPKPAAQLENYNFVYRTHRSETTWMAVIDVDEYLFGVRQPLRKVLEAQLAPVYISVPWVVFGSSGRVQQPQSIRKSFLYRHPYDQRAQSPQRFGVEYPDSFVWFKGLFHTSLVKSLHVHEHNTVLGAPMLILAQDDPNIRLHHYIIQSWEYFAATKIDRGDSFFKKGANPRKIRDRKYFDTWDAPAIIYDDTLANLPY